MGNLDWAAPGSQFGSWLGLASWGYLGSETADREFSIFQSPVMQVHFNKKGGKNVSPVGRCGELNDIMWFLHEIFENPLYVFVVFIIMLFVSNILRFVRIESLGY